MLTALQRKALLTEARYLGEKAEAEGRDFTSEETARITEIKSQIEASDERAESSANARGSIKAAIGGGDDDGSDPHTKAAGISGGPGTTVGKAIMAQIREKAGDANFKAVTSTSGTVTVPVGEQRGVATLAQSKFLLSQLVQIIPADSNQDGDLVSYLKQVGRTLASATVARGGTKPASALAFEAAGGPYATVAHLVDVPNQFLESFSKFAQVIELELLYGLALGLDEILLNGGVDENGDPFAGILGTTGVKATAFATDKLLTIRRAIGSIEVEGSAPTAVVLHPTDWEELETLKIADGRYLMDGAPNAAGEPNLWGVPVQLAPAVGVGRAVVGAFDQFSIGLANKGGIKVQWNPYRKDDTNETVVRCEGRFLPVIARPASFAVADLTAA